MSVNVDYAMKSPLVTSMSSVAGESGMPWDGVAKSIPPDASPLEALEAAGLDWQVLRVPLIGSASVELPDGTTGTIPVPIPKSFALIKDSDHHVLSPYVGDRYKMIQNDEAFEVFHNFVQTSGMVMETAGALSEGQYVWGLASLGDGYPLADGEVIKGYFLLVQSHKYGNSLRAMFTPVRFPGGHTFMTPLRITKGTGIYRMPHSRFFNEERKSEILEVLGAARAELKNFHEKASFLSRIKMPENITVKVLTEVLDPEMAARAKRHNTPLPATLKELHSAEGIKRALRDITTMTQDYAGHDLPSCEGTAWGTFQLISHAFDHAFGKSIDTRLESSWFGVNSSKKQKAFNATVRYAQAIDAMG